MSSVLLVDDDRALRKVLRAYLEQEVIAVVEAGSGEDAPGTPVPVILVTSLEDEVVRTPLSAIRASPTVLPTRREVTAPVSRARPQAGGERTMRARRGGGTGQTRPP